VDQLYFRIA